MIELLCRNINHTWQWLRVRSKKRQLATYAVVLHKENWMRDNAAWYFYGGVNLRF